MRGNRATIRWTTLASGSGSVWFQREGGTVHTAVAKLTTLDPARTGRQATSYLHEALLFNLVPGTDYRYRVLMNGESIAGDQEFTFRTSDITPFNFLAVGDTGMGTEEQSRIAAQMDRERSRLLIHTGDVVYPLGTYEAYESRYLNYYRPMMQKVPFFPCLGNHDYFEARADAYCAIHDLPNDQVPVPDHGRYYSYDWHNVHFVSLDSNNTLIDAARGLNPMLEWLDADLAQTKKFWRIVYFHHPPYATGVHAGDPLVALARERIVPILEKHRVPLVLSGHEHNYQRSKPLFRGTPAQPGEGAVYVITGGGGADLYRFNPNSQTVVGAAVHHYLRCETEGARMTVRAVDLNGAEVDRFTVSPPPMLSDRAVLNSASFEPAIARGGLVSIFGVQLAPEDFIPSRGILPLDANGLTVALNGQLLPLMMVSPTQINAVVPFSIVGAATLRVTTRNGSVQTDVTVSEVAPAIFASAIFREDGRPVDEQLPAAPGRLLTIYATGLGAVEGDVPLGRPVSGLFPVSAPLTVLIGGRAVAPVSAALAEGLVGVYKVSCIVPEMPAASHDLRLQAGDILSNVVPVSIG